MTDARRTYERLQIEIANAETALHLAVADFGRTLSSASVASDATPRRPNGALAAKARILVARALDESPNGLSTGDIIAFAESNGWQDDRATLYTVISKLAGTQRIVCHGEGRGRMYFAKRQVT